MSDDSPATVRTVKEIVVIVNLRFDDFVALADGKQDAINSGNAAAVRTLLGLASMAQQASGAVNITGGSAIGMSTLRVFNSAAGAGSGYLEVRQADTANGTSHRSLFSTEQLGNGGARTLFYAASPATDGSRGQFDIITEDGSKFLGRLGHHPGNATALDLNDLAAGNALKVRLTTNGNSYLLGGNFGLGTNNPQFLLEVGGTMAFTPGGSVTPNNNGQVVFELTNNTTLKIKAKGSDGVVRSASITLA